MLYVPPACVAFTLTHCFLHPPTHRGRKVILWKRTAGGEEGRNYEFLLTKGYVKLCERARGGMPGLWVHPACACGQSMYCVVGQRRRRKGSKIEGECLA